VRFAEKLVRDWIIRLTSFPGAQKRNQSYGRQKLSVATVRQGLIATITLDFFFSCFGIGHNVVIQIGHFYPAKHHRIDSVETIIRDLILERISED
jgi:hypothetical protein